MAASHNLSVEVALDDLVSFIAANPDGTLSEAELLEVGKLLGRPTTFADLPGSLGAITGQSPAALKEWFMQSIPNLPRWLDAKGYEIIRLLKAEAASRANVTAALQVSVS